MFDGDGMISDNQRAPAVRPIEGRAASLFLLAHPDDELAFAPLLDMLVSAGRPVRLVYMTNGEARGVSASTRIAESIAALDHIGIPASHAHFIGSDAGIPDGMLYQHMERAAAAIEALRPSLGDIGAIYSFAWEGGHVDHDAALLIAAAFAVKLGLCDNFWQLPFYRASDILPAPLFTLSAPLPANGTVMRLPLNARQKRRPRELIRFYPSQRTTFIGLGPFILWHSIVRSSLGLQQMDLNRLLHRPTAKPLLYERRSDVSFEAFSKAALSFWESRGLPQQIMRAAA